MRDLSHDDDAIARLLTSARTIAVLGAHDDPARPAHYVPAYVFSRGVRILPVNPMRIGTRLFDENVRGTLAEWRGIAIDIVDVFRRSVDVPAHLDDILAMDPLPKCVWLQLGIRHEETARALIAKGIEVVQDRCLLVDHRAYVR
jgi:predicted CoA-binding protein